ncbi:MAG: gamma-glutamyl-gamma-aminobutyrate hydrolase family protein [Planctomycetaceae bacterium]
MTPLIGITTYGRDEDNRFRVPGDYVDAVRRAGGVPVLIPPGGHGLEFALARVDGLILAGGGDINPQHYGGTMHETIYSVDAERDASEMILARAVVESGMPTFGICRGLQLINVALGGTLHEHLPDVVGESVLHRLPPREATEHAVRVKSGSKLGDVLLDLEFTAASWHHQAVRDVAPGLNVVAHAPDGTIEALEKTDHPWLIAVQWHPELTAAVSATQQRLFDAFVAATKSPKPARN